MSGFVRPANWLRHLFTSSQTGPVNPTEVSDDVSLIQPYDGGGYPLFDPGEWAKDSTSATGAAKTTALFSVPDDKIARILSASIVHTAGVAPDVYFRVETPQFSMGISENLTALADAEDQGFQIHSPIIGPGHNLVGRHFGGDGSTVIIFRLYLCVVPIGTVFYV